MTSIETRDTDYVFISFVTSYLPSGLVGLLLAVIFAAAMSSVASELNALASCTTVDFTAVILEINLMISTIYELQKLLP